MITNSTCMHIELLVCDQTEDSSMFFRSISVSSLISSSSSVLSSSISFMNDFSDMVSSWFVVSEPVNLVITFLISFSSPTQAKYSHKI